MYTHTYNLRDIHDVNFVPGHGKVYPDKLGAVDVESALDNRGGMECGDQLRPRLGHMSIHQHRTDNLHPDAVQTKKICMIMNCEREKRENKYEERRRKEEIKGGMEKRIKVGGVGGKEELKRTIPSLES